MNINQDEILKIVNEIDHFKLPKLKGEVTLVPSPTSPFVRVYDDVNNECTYLVFHLDKDYLYVSRWSGKDLISRFQISCNKNSVQELKDLVVKLQSQ